MAANASFLQAIMMARSNVMFVMLGNSRRRIGQLQALNTATTTTRFMLHPRHRLGFVGSSHSAAPRSIMLEARSLLSSSSFTGDGVRAKGLFNKNMLFAILGLGGCVVGAMYYAKKTAMKDTNLPYPVAEALAAGVKYLEKEDFVKAKESYLKAADLLKDIDVTHPGLVRVYDRVANIEFQLKNYDTAKAYFIGTIQGLVHKGVSTEDDAVLELSLKLANVHEKLGEADLAESGYRYCVDTARKKFPAEKSFSEAQDNGLALRGLSQDRLAAFYTSQRRNFKEAEDLYLDSLNIAENCLSKDGQLQVPLCLNNLAILYFEEGKYFEAKKVAQRALKIATAVYTDAEEYDLIVYKENLHMIEDAMKNLNNKGKNTS